QQCHSTERFAMIGMEWLGSGGVAVINGGDFSGATYIKVNEILCQRTQIPIFVLDTNSDVRKIVAVGVDHVTVSDKLKASGCRRGAHLLLSHLLSPRVGDRLQSARLIRHLPDHAIFGGKGSGVAHLLPHWHLPRIAEPLLSAERLSVQE